VGQSGRLSAHCSDVKRNSSLTACNGLDCLPKQSVTVCMSVIRDISIQSHKVDQHGNSECSSPIKQKESPTFGELAASYQEFEIPRLAHTTAYAVRHNLSHYILPRWSNQVAIELKPLEIEAWFVALQQKGLAPPTISKLRAIMQQVYRHSQRVGLISRSQEANPITFARARGKSNYKPVLISPQQAFHIIELLNPHERTLAFLSAATGLRISESLGLKWMDLDFTGQQIFVRRTWIQGKVGRPKTAASASTVPMAETLAAVMNAWKMKTQYPGENDWVFPSLRKHGKQPREGAIAAADYLRPAAIKAGVIPKGYAGRFGWHNFRHSIASSLLSEGVNAKVVQGILRHSRVEVTLNLYCHSTSTESLKAQERFALALRPSS
jgi:integrase